MADKSIWIARDAAKILDISSSNFLERHPEKEYIYGELHIFYDKPLWQSGEWIAARNMVASVSNYMFPEIKCETCVEFKGHIPEEQD